MRRLAAIIALSALAAGCGSWRSTEQEIIELDGLRFLCTYTLNHFSGNKTESVCTQIVERAEGAVDG